MVDKAESGGVDELQDGIAAVALDGEGDGGSEAASAAGGAGRGDGSGESLDCAICLLPCTLPLSLPCGHTFCYLCAKGVAFRSRRCALCRKAIPDDVIAKPRIDRNQVEPVSLDRGHEASTSGEKCTEHGDAEAVWHYEGRNGWWQYEPRSNREIEEAYLAEKKSCEVLIAGFVYLIDLENLVQSRRSQNTRKRRICRNLSRSAVRKGVAGVPFQGAQVEAEADQDSKRDE